MYRRPPPSLTPVARFYSFGFLFTESLRINDPSNATNKTIPNHISSVRTFSKPYCTKCHTPLPMRIINKSSLGTVLPYLYLLILFLF